MKDHKKYIHIEQMSDKHIDSFLPGDHIIIQEKLDGANASFQYDAESDSLVCFSRNHPLDAEDTLRGFYDWVQGLDKELVYSILGDNRRVFGEWLVKHTVKYPEEKYSMLYIFDIYDMEKRMYYPQEYVKAVAEALGIPYVPVFYDGVFKSWDEIMPLIGRTEMGGEIGEGIIVKNLSRLCHSKTGLPAYTKLVHERFQEVFRKARERRQGDPEEHKARFLGRQAAESIVTPARVEKMLHKLVDEGILPEDFSIRDMQTICKNLPSAVYYDCLKEEPETVNSVDNFGKHCGAVTLKLAKEIVIRRMQNG